MFAPCHLICPSAGARSPHSIRSKLVLPLPFGPVSWTKVPGDTAKSSPLKSLRSPRTHPSLLSSSIVDRPPLVIVRVGHKKAQKRQRKFQPLAFGWTGPFAFNHSCQPPCRTF